MNYKRQFKKAFTLCYSQDPTNKMAGINFYCSLITKKVPAKVQAQAWASLGEILEYLQDQKDKTVLKNKSFLNQMRAISKLGLQNKKPDPIRCYQKALSLDPENYDANYAFAQELQKKGKPLLKIIFYYEKALQIEKKSHYSALFLGDLYSDLAKKVKQPEKSAYNKKALEFYQRTKKIAPHIAGNYLLDTKIRNLKKKVELSK